MSRRRRRRRRLGMGLKSIANDRLTGATYRLAAVCKVVLITCQDEENEDDDEERQVRQTAETHQLAD